MEAHSRAIDILVLDDGTCPYEEWIDGLRDVSFQRAIDARLTRVRNGNFGDHKSVGGDKSTQQKDIREAQKLWRDRIATR